MLSDCLPNRQREREPKTISERKSNDDAPAAATDDDDDVDSPPPADLALVFLRHSLSEKPKEMRRIFRPGKLDSREAERTAKIQQCSELIFYLHASSQIDG